MRDISDRNFGLLIAYLVPGFVTLWGASFFAPELEIWLLGPSREGPTLGGFLYVTVGSVAAGMVTNAVRWAFVDSIHHLTGLQRPIWDDAVLHERVTAYEWLVENHYRHYQFYGNTLIGALFAFACWRIPLAETAPGLGWLDGAAVALSLILAAGSRSTLARYYRRTESLLGSIQEGHDEMANGGHPSTKPNNPKPQETAKPPKGNQAQSSK